METLRAQNINPSILTWARETAGLSADEAADRLGLSSGAEELEDFEAGKTKPTRDQLLKLASVYRRPLLTFYLKAPPASDNFRRIARLWSAYHGGEFTEKDVGAMMLLLKAARMAAPDGGTDDTFVDAVAYAALSSVAK